jgi:hypothetical protein
MKSLFTFAPLVLEEFCDALNLFHQNSRSSSPTLVGNRFRSLLENLIRHLSLHLHEETQTCTHT